MTLIARFIGIDRYRDPDIQDLAGAARDARAMWALFADTIPDADARLITDQEATHATVRAASLDFPGLAGTGRLLLAASRLDQPAYEHPQHRHGLLTYALLRVLQQGEGVVSLAAAFDEVLQIVRSEAATLGMDQTPVVFGFVEGGLTIPVLHRGVRFLEAFPESRAYQVSSAMADLPHCGVPDSVVT